jgi:hypothetical protein
LGTIHLFLKQTCTELTQLVDRAHASSRRLGEGAMDSGLFTPAWLLLSSLCAATLARLDLAALLKAVAELRESNRKAQVMLNVLCVGTHVPCGT